MDAVRQADKELTRRLVDLKVAPSPGSLMRAIILRRCGETRLARRDAEFYSISITCQGSCGYLRVTDNHGIPKFYQPSAFTGSFVIGGHCRDGLIVDMEAATPPTVCINWRESDLEIV
jgi:hypothetical protein